MILLCTTPHFCQERSQFIKFAWDSVSCSVCHHEKHYCNFKISSYTVGFPPTAPHPSPFTSYALLALSTIISKVDVSSPKIIRILSVVLLWHTLVNYSYLITKTSLWMQCTQFHKTITTSFLSLISPWFFVVW